MSKTSPDGTRYCRTCGFSDCPGADGGDCPRWPARGQADPAYALLTPDGLYDLHARLCKQSREIHATLMDGLTARISPLSDVWKFQSARLGEISETIDAVFAEIQRRVNGKCQACSDPACPGYVSEDTAGA